CACVRNLTANASIEDTAPRGSRVREFVTGAEVRTRGGCERTVLKETSAVVQNAIHAHKTLDRMKQEKILAEWDSKWSGDFKTDAWIETLYNSLTGTQGKFMKHN
ncbi:MAG: hypothetical protein WBW14_01390, partial [Candidatus Acidiferrum sp.]